MSWDDEEEEDDDDEEEDDEHHLFPGTGKKKNGKKTVSGFPWEKKNRAKKCAGAKSLKNCAKKCPGGVSRRASGVLITI